MICFAPWYVRFLSYALLDFSKDGFNGPKPEGDSEHAHVGLSRTQEFGDFRTTLVASVAVCTWWKLFIPTSPSVMRRIPLVIRTALCQVRWGIQGNLGSGVEQVVPEAFLTCANMSRARKGCF